MKKNPQVVAALMLCACPCVKAADVENAFADSTRVETLNDVEVVATRATNTTPIAFSNLTAKEIAKVNTGVDLPYLLLSTPSVVMTSDAGAGVGYTSIRVRGTDGSRINVTTNGIPVNDAESHKVYWVNMPDFVSTLKDVQVQRGAGTSTNGAGAFGASINMQTSSPDFDPYAAIDASYGMYNTNKQTLKVGTGLLADHWAVNARISHIGSDGYIDRASSRLWSYFTQAAYYDGATSLKLLVFGGKERTYQAWDYATKDQIEKYGRRYNPCGAYTDASGKPAYYPDQYDYYTQQQYQLIFNTRIASKWYINAGLHYTKGFGYYEQYKTSQKFKKYSLTPYYDADGQLISRSDLIRLKHLDNDFGGGVFSVKYSADGVTATVGGGINRYHGSHFGQISWLRNYVGALNPLQEYYRNKANKLDGNIYARANVDLSHGLTGYVDLQYRYIKYKITGLGDNFVDDINAMQPLDVHTSFNFFNPKAGIDYQINRQQRAYASVSVAHREPARDNFVDRPSGRDPKAERLIDYELGYAFANSQLNAGVNLYYMDYKDQLVPTGMLSDTGNTVAENVPSSYRAGVELTLGYKPVSWFDWQFTSTLSRNRIKEYVEYIYGDEAPLEIDRKDMPISFSPEVTLHNAFNFGYQGFDASVQTQYVGRQYLDNSGDKSVSLDPYIVTDLHAGYTFKQLRGIEEMRIGCTIYNLFSEKYCNNGYAYSYYYMDGADKVIAREAGYAVQAPIHFMATVSLKF